MRLEGYIEQVRLTAAKVFGRRWGELGLGREYGLRLKKIGVNAC